MDVQQYFTEKKKLYNILHEFIESDVSDENSVLIQNLSSMIQKNLENQEELKELLTIVSKIADYHCRCQNFNDKIETIITIIENQIKENISNTELFNIFKNNKKIIHFLFKKQILQMNNNILNNQSFSLFFYPEIKLSGNMMKIKEIENKLLAINENIFNDFDQKRDIGENDSYICELIRNDSVKEFITYVNQANINLSSKINSSIFETNPILIENEPTLIEYSAFFGSIQIFQYLRLNNVKLTQSLWLYAIHSKNAEMINFLENVKPEKTNYQQILEESIKCHHNEITYYFLDNYIIEPEKIRNFQNNIFAYCFHYHNYEFMPIDINQCPYIPYYIFQYEYDSMIHFLLQNQGIDLNNKIVLNSNILRYFCFNY